MLVIEHADENDGVEALAELGDVIHGEVAELDVGTPRSARPSYAL